MRSASIVARNSVYGLLALGIDKGVFMVIIIALARYLSTADFGRWAFVMTYVAVLQIGADLGLEMLLIRRVSEQPAERDRLLANGLGLRLVSGVVFWALAIALIPVIADLTYMRLTLIAGSCLVSSTWMAYKIVYRSLMRIEYLLLLVTVNTVTTALCVLFVIIGHWPVTGAIAAMAVGSAVTLPFAVWLSRHHFRLRLRYEPALWATLLRQALPLGINAVLVNLSLRIGPLLLLRLQGPEEVAFFSAASKLVEAFVLLPEVPMLTIFPMMAATRRAGEDRLPALTRTATRWTVTLLLPLILVVGGLAKPLLHMLYGEAFGTADDTLRVLVWITAFAATGAVWIGVLTTLGLQQLLVRFYAAGTVINAFLCWALIPALGSMGAAWAALLAAVVPQALLLWLPATRPYIRPAFLGVVPVLVLAMILTVVIPLLPFAPVPATALGLAGYAVACVVTGVIGPQEWRLARQLVQRSAH